ncbi:hypothetical protein [Echinicola pacifica]|uniref:hypothetical protein n=1 Tax=Echinicola pacifica TaxID=346377 RepID=UPI00035E28DB|nr:hypothetical protein [Echinicola pacifica]
MKKSKSIFTDQKGDQGLWKSIKFVERRLPEAIVESEKLRLMDRIPQEEEPPVIPIRSRKKSPWIS